MMHRLCNKDTYIYTWWTHHKIIKKKKENDWAHSFFLKGLGNINNDTFLRNRLKTLKKAICTNLSIGEIQATNSFVNKGMNILTLLPIWWKIFGDLRSPPPCPETQMRSYSFMKFKSTKFRFLIFFIFLNKIFKTLLSSTHGTLNMIKHSYHLTFFLQVTWHI